MRKSTSAWKILPKKKPTKKYSINEKERDKKIAEELINSKIIEKEYNSDEEESNIDNFNEDSHKDNSVNINGSSLIDSMDDEDKIMDSFIKIDKENK